jgi:hypothetical protein
VELVQLAGLPGDETVFEAQLTGRIISASFS